VTAHEPAEVDLTPPSEQQLTNFIEQLAGGTLRPAPRRRLRAPRRVQSAVTTVTRWLLANPIPPAADPVVDQRAVRPSRLTAGDILRDRRGDQLHVRTVDPPVVRITVWVGKPGRGHPVVLEIPARQPVLAVRPGGWGSEQP